MADPVTLRIPVQQVQELISGLSDLACWLRGYRAGRPDDDANDPLGVEALREINIKLKTALSDAEEIPF